MNTGCLTVTDGEVGIRSAIAEYFPAMPLFLCWNHKISNVEMFLRQTLCVTDVRVISYYIKAVRDLFFQPTREQYDTLYNRYLDGYNGPGEKLEQWNSKFSDYYAKNVHSVIETIACFAVRDKIGALWNEFSGITTNHGEGLNNLVKWFQDRKFLSLDLVMLSIYQITIYYYNEIKRGFGNLGEYQLKTLFQSCYIAVTMAELRECKHPTQVIKELEENYQSYTANFNSTQVLDGSTIISQDSVTSIEDSTSIDNEPISSTPTEQSPDLNVNLSLVENAVLETIQEVVEPNVEPSSSNNEPFSRPSRFNSLISRAMSFVKNGHLTHLIAQKVYQCIDEEKVCHQISSVVNKTSMSFCCSCPITLKCVHIMAVEYSLGKPIDELYTMPNRATIRKSKLNGKVESGLKMKHHAENTNQPTNKIDAVIEESEKQASQSQKTKAKSSTRKKIFIKHYKYLDQLININYDSYKEKNNVSFFEETSIVTDANKLGDRFLTFNINFIFY
jgi:hypothetical protein